MNIRSLFRGGHARIEANLDAFIDGALDPATHQRLALHLESCDACKLRVATGRSLRLALAALPELPAPRSFVITESMLARPRVAAPAHSGAWTGAMRSMQGIAAAGLALFAILVVADLSGGTAATSSGDDDAQRSSLTAGAEAQPNAAQDDATTADDGDNTFDDGNADATAAVLPPGTPEPGGVDAQDNARPTRAPGETPGDSSSPDSASGSLPEASDAGGDSAPAVSQAAYYAADDSGGISRLRLGELLAAAVAVLAVVGVVVTRRLAPDRQR